MCFVCFRCRGVPQGVQQHASAVLPASGTGAGAVAARASSVLPACDVAFLHDAPEAADAVGWASVFAPPQSEAAARASLPGQQLQLQLRGEQQEQEQEEEEEDFVQGIPLYSP